MKEQRPGGKKAGKNFEQAIAEIEGIVEEIEAGELPLDEIVPRFRRATTLISKCREILSDVEQQIQVIEAEANIGDDGEQDREDGKDLL